MTDRIKAQENLIMRFVIFDNSQDQEHFAVAVAIGDGKGEVSENVLNGLKQVACDLIDDYIQKVTDEYTLEGDELEHFKNSIRLHKKYINRATTQEDIQRAVWGLDDYSVDDSEFHCDTHILLVF